MPDYQNGKIYRLVNNTSGLTYYGSTCQSLSKRLHDHRKKCNQIENKRCMSYLLFTDNNDVDIVLVEKYPCSSKEELYTRERHFIENNDCVNKLCPIRTKTEKKEYQCTWAQKWRIKNPDKVKEISKRYYENNSEKISEMKKKRRVNNLEHYRAKDKQYREAGLDRIKVYMSVYNKIKYTCECGSTLNKAKKSVHEHSKKHLKYIADNKCN